MTLPAQRYPIGIQSFRQIREGGYIYVDKTVQIHQLVCAGKYYFLSRPRRFGKSLLISTMEEYFRGSRELFSGLAIDSLQPEPWEAHPVFHLDLNSSGYNNPTNLNDILNARLSAWENNYGLETSAEDVAFRFQNIIRKVFAKTQRKVVVLIDEYDKPIMDCTNEPELQNEMRRILRNFYGVMKSNDDYLKFVFLTGVGKIGQMNVFSGLNNLNDISLDDPYAAICGITSKELTTVFHPGIEEMAKEYRLDFNGMVKELKANYDGYHFSRGLIDVYNPFSLMSALSKKEIASYWYSTGTPTRLVNMLMRQEIDVDELDNYVVDRDDLSDGNMLSDRLIPNLYFTGYLTIRDYDREERKYILGFPNNEVRTGFLRNLVPYFTGEPYRTDWVNNLRKYILAGDLDRFMTALDVFFASCPYQINCNNEKYYQSVIYIIARLAGFDADVERTTSYGRIDMTIDTPATFYIFEFKIDKSTKEALAQIDEKEYALPFALGSKPIVKVGVNFSSKTRKIDSWEAEE